MIETAAGLAAVEEICSVPGLSGIYVGPADLAISLGVPVAGATTDPRALDAIARAHRAASAAGVVAGIHAGNGATGKELAALGFQLITLAAESRHTQARPRISTMRRAHDEPGRAGHRAARGQGAAIVARLRADGFAVAAPTGSRSTPGIPMCSRSTSTSVRRRSGRRPWRGWSPTSVGSTCW